VVVGVHAKSDKEQRRGKVSADKSNAHQALLRWRPMRMKATRLTAT